jgi:hypothetical protein
VSLNNKLRKPTHRKCTGTSIKDLLVNAVREVITVYTETPTYIMWSNCTGSEC